MSITVMQNIALNLPDIPSRQSLFGFVFFCYIIPGQ